MKKTTHRLRILHLEDNEEDAELIAWELKKSDIEAEIKVVNTRSEYQAALKEFAPEMVISDHSLPSFNSIEALGILRNSGLQIPFIFLTGFVPDEVAIVAMNNGAESYILKDTLQRLPDTIRKAMEKSGERNVHTEEKADTAEREKRCMEIMQHLPTPVYMCDVSGRLVVYNRAASMLWGREPDVEKEMWCGSYKMYAATGELIEREKSPVARALLEGISKQGEELMIERPDGTVRHVTSHPILNYNSDGEVTGATNMLTDITEQKSAELAAFVLAERLQRKNRELGQLTYSVSHILRAPVARILGLSNLLGIEPSEDKFIVRKIAEEAINLDSAIREMNMALFSILEEA